MYEIIIFVLLNHFGVTIVLVCRWALRGTDEFAMYVGVENSTKNWEPFY